MLLLIVSLHKVHLSKLGQKNPIPITRLTFTRSKRLTGARHFKQNRIHTRGARSTKVRTIHSTIYMRIQWIHFMYICAAWRWHLPDYSVWPFVRLDSSPAAARTQTRSPFFSNRPFRSVLYRHYVRIRMGREGWKGRTTLSEVWARVRSPLQPNEPLKAEAAAAAACIRATCKGSALGCPWNCILVTLSPDAALLQCFFSSCFGL